MRKQLRRRDWPVLYEFDDVVTCCVGDTKASRRARLQTGFQESRGRGIIHLCQRVCSRVQREVFARSLPMLLEMSEAAGGRMVACNSRIHRIDRSSGLREGHGVRRHRLAALLYRVSRKERVLQTTKEETRGNTPVDKRSEIQRASKGDNFAAQRCANDNFMCANYWSRKAALVYRTGIKPRWNDFTCAIWGSRSAAPFRRINIRRDRALRIYHRP